MRELESAIETRFATGCKRLGLEPWQVVKMKSTGRAGIPDRLIVLPSGRVFWIEFKRPGEKPRPVQEAMIRNLRRLGHEVEVFDDAGAALDAVSRELG